MGQINFKKNVSYSMDEAIKRAETALKAEGFGVLTRIDFHSKVKEKLGKDIEPTVILGACSPSLAYEVFMKDRDVTALMPCNVVFRQIENQKISIEIAKPTSFLELLEKDEIMPLACDADEALQRVIAAI